MRSIAFILIFLLWGTKSFFCAASNVGDDDAQGLPITPNSIAKRIDLSPSEKTWLSKHNTIRPRVGTSPPYHYWENGKEHGISVDYIRAFCEGFKITCAFISGPPWAKAIENIGKGKDGDVILTINHTPQRESQIAFTVDYLQPPWVIFTREDSPFVAGIADLHGKSVSIEHGFVLQNLLKQSYPDIRQQIYPTSKDAIEALATGQVDAYIGNLTVTTYLISRHGYNNVQVSAPTPFGNHSQSMGVRKDWPELAGLLSKFIQAMTPGEHAAIRNKWLSVRYEYGIDPSKIAQIGGVAILVVTIIVVIILVWNRRLKAEVNLREQKEEELKESQERLTEAQHLAHLGSWTLELPSNVLSWSDEIFEIFGIDPDTFSASYDAFLDVIHPDDRDFVNEKYTESVQTGSSYDIEHRIIRQSDGAVRWVHEKCRHTVNADGKIIKSIGTVQDTTEHKALMDQLLRAKDDAEAADKAKSEFLANMSHELRTPLNSILGFSEIMFEQQFGPLGTARYEEYARDINTSGRLLLKIIDDILDLSRIEAGMGTLEESDFDPDLVLESCVRIMHLKAAERRIRMPVYVEPGLPKIRADLTRIKQIILNILSNALKFTKNDGEIKVSCTRSDSNGILFAVQDDGIGMTEDEVMIALQPFAQVQSVHNRNHQGTGLGLPIAKSFAEMHGGVLDIRSRPGNGTTVSVSLPPSRVILERH